jgi:hypothetical protein
LFSEVPLRFLALRAAKRAFLSGSSLKTEVFRDALNFKPGEAAHCQQIKKNQESGQALCARPFSKK